MVDVKTNYKNKFKFNMQCRICNLDEESERHLIKCSEVLKKMDEDFNFIDVDYLDIFSQNLENQIKI